MSRAIADPLYERLLRAYPPNQAYVPADWADAPMPAPLRHFLQHRLRHQKRQEARRIQDAHSAWVRSTHPSVRKAQHDYLDAIESHLCIPPDEWPAALQQAARHVTTYLVRPVPVLIAFLFSEGDGPCPVHRARWRMRYFSAHAYLREAVEAFIRKHERSTLPRESLQTFLQRVDTSMVAEYSAEQWLRLLTPLFSLARVATDRAELPASMLHTFFAQKKAEQYAESVQAFAQQDEAPWVSARQLKELLTETESPEPVLDDPVPDLNTLSVPPPTDVETPPAVPSSAEDALSAPETPAGTPVRTASTSQSSPEEASPDEALSAEDASAEDADEDTPDEDTSDEALPAPGSSDPLAAPAKPRRAAASEPDGTASDGTASDDVAPDPAETDSPEPEASGARASETPPVAPPSSRAPRPSEEPPAWPPAEYRQRWPGEHDSEPHDSEHDAATASGEESTAEPATPDDAPESMYEWPPPEPTEARDAKDGGSVAANEGPGVQASEPTSAAEPAFEDNPTATRTAEDDAPRKTSTDDSVDDSVEPSRENAPPAEAASEKDASEDSPEEETPLEKPATEATAAEETAAEETAAEETAAEETAAEETAAEERAAEEEDTPLWKRFQGGSRRSRSASTESSAASSEESSTPLWARFQSKNDASSEPQASASGGDAARPVPSEPDLRDDLPALEQAVLGSNVPDQRDDYIRHLFDGSVSDYHSVLTMLQEADTWTEASRVIAREVFRAHQVNIYSDVAVRFTDAVEEQFHSG